MTERPDGRPARRAADPLLLPLICLALVAGASVVSMAWQRPAGSWPELVALTRSGDVSALIFSYGHLPRVAVSLLAGAMLGLSGAMLQHVLHNPLAEPSTLGVSAGAYLALMVATLWCPAALAVGREGVAFAGAAASLALVVLLARGARNSPTAVLLAGAIVTLTAGSIAALLALLNQDYLGEMFIWQSGSLVQKNWDVALRFAFCLVPALFVTTLLLRPLTLLGLADDASRGLGMPAGAFRGIAIAVAVGLGAIVVAGVGVIGFIGLAANALCNAVGVRTLRQRLVAAPAVGASLLGLADLAVRHVEVLKGVPTGAITAFIGAPLLLMMIGKLPAAQPQTSSMPHVSPLRHRPVALAVILIAAFALASMVGRDADGWRLDAWSEALRLWPWRGPRLLAAFGSGAMLGCAGALMQRLTGNPMASPEILGISSGAAIAVILAVLLLPGLDISLISLMAFVGAFVALTTLVTISLRAGFTSERLLLSGIAIGTISTALCAIALANGDQRSIFLLWWMAGSTYRVTAPEAYIVLAVAAFVPLASLLMARPLEVLRLGESGARSLGVALTPIRLSNVVLVAIAASTATLSVGPLSFVGLAGPHIARLLGFRGTARHLLASAGIGGSVMMVADWIGRTALFPWEIPAGVIASLIGGPYLLWLIQRR